MSEENKEIKKRIDEGINSDAPKIYFNGFVNIIGAGDILMVLEKNGKPAAVINTSYSVAKTLALKLNGLIQQLEHATDNKIMTTDHIDKAFKGQRG